MNDGGRQMKINKWTRRDTDRGIAPPEKTAEEASGASQPPDGLSEAGIREALRDVRDPEIGRDLVSLNMVRGIEIADGAVTVGVALTTAGCPLKHRITTDVRDRLDRKSTRLNSSHANISYAVFCLKKKN